MHDKYTCPLLDCETKFPDESEKDGLDAIITHLRVDHNYSSKLYIKVCTHNSCKHVIAGTNMTELADELEIHKELEHDLKQQDSKKTRKRSKG